MKISNLSNADFKTLAIRMLQELSGYFNSIKDSQSEIKGTLIAIKKNLQGIDSGVDEAKDQINDLEYKEAKASNQNSKKKKELKK